MSEHWRPASAHTRVSKARSQVAPSAFVVFASFSTGREAWDTVLLAKSSTHRDSVSHDEKWMHSSVYAYVETQRSIAGSFVVLYFLFLRQGLALNLWLVSLAKPTGQQTPGSACLYSVTPGPELKACNLTGFLDLNEVLLIVQALY